jgi:hypothetical protein
MTNRADVERERFLAECWERGVAPSDDAWEAHLLQLAYRRLTDAHEFVRHVLDPEWEADGACDAAADKLIAWLNSGSAVFRMSGIPTTDSALTDDEVLPAMEARGVELQTMPYPEYLRTPEWGGAATWRAPAREPLVRDVQQPRTASHSPQDVRPARDGEDRRPESCCARTATSPSTQTEAVTASRPDPDRAVRVRHLVWRS